MINGPLPKFHGTRDNLRLNNEHGRSLAEIADPSNAHPNTVWLALRARGVRMRSAQGRER
jgi:hypothetical protein